jgi:sulfate transport system permease protein
MRRDRRSKAARLAVRFVALGYLALLVLVPLALVFRRAFAHGLAPVWDALTTPDALHALQLSLEATVIAVVLNTLFGIALALYLARRRGRLATAIGAFIDLPLALSPVVVGLALMLVFARTGWLGSWLDAHGIQVMFAFPAIVIATAFVSLPFVARELVPVLREIGVDQHHAAATLGAGSWQTFRRVTLPAMRGALVYGIVLTAARSLGEFGAVSVVSGRIVGQTETLTLLVQDRFESFDTVGAYSTALLLAAISVATLLLLNLIRPMHERREAR